MAVEDHFDRLVKDLGPEEQKAFRAGKNTRVETAFRNRHFIVYEMTGRQPEELDRILVNDFRVDDEEGATAELTSLKTGNTLVIGYTPVRLLSFPIFLWLPLHARIRWGAPAGDVYTGSLGFPIVIATRSRLHLRERGVTYFETGPAFGKEFDK